MLSRDHLVAKGVYDSFDSIVRYYDDESQVTNIATGHRIIEHEVTHFFQNYFTAQGQSNYWIVRLINSALDDLLRQCDGTVVLPFLPWLQSPDSPLRSKKAIESFDRLTRLLVQLATAGVSQRIVLENQATLSKLNIVDAFLTKCLSLNTQHRYFCVDDQPIFPIDYAAICESMAKAMEYFNASRNLVRDTYGISHTTTISEYLVKAWHQKMSELAEAECQDPRLLNYTFPLLLLLQSGFNFRESLQITILLSYIALMWQWSLPGLPEFGADEIRKFGTVASAAYVKLLDAACQDDFVPAIDSAADILQSGGSVVEYLDRLSTKAGLDPVGQKLEGFLYYTEHMLSSFQKDSEKSDEEVPGNGWYLHLIEIAGKFVRAIQSEPLVSGLALITSPFQFMHEHNVGPLIISNSGYLNVKKDESFKIREHVTFCFTMRFNKVILFESEIAPIWLDQSTEDEHGMGLKFYEYLSKRFRIDSVRIGV